MVDLRDNRRWHIQFLVVKLVARLDRVVESLWSNSARVTEGRQTHTVTMVGVSSGDRVLNIMFRPGIVENSRFNQRGGSYC